MGLQDSDLILVERGNTLYKETYGNRANINSSDLLLVERNNTLYKCTYANWANANNTDLILVEANSTTNGRVVGQLYKETKSNWPTSSYTDIHSANHMVTLGTLLYGQAKNNGNNFSVVETQVEVSSSAAYADGTIFIGFRNSAATSYMGDLPIAAVQILESDGSTFRVNDDFYMDFNFAIGGSYNTQGYYWWSTTESTNTNSSTDPSTYTYETISTTNTKRRFSYTDTGVGSNHVGAALGISSSTYNGAGNTVLAVGNANISQSSDSNDGYLFSECSSTSTGDLTWMLLGGTGGASSGRIYNGDRIRICYFGGGNGNTSNNGLQTTNSLYLRFIED